MTTTLAKAHWQTKIPELCTIGKFLYNNRWSSATATEVLEYAFVFTAVFTQT